jgi:triosephosphate isomerase (TIM)
VSVHPPFTDIRSVQTLIAADTLDIFLGAQHCHWEDSGAFTGEVSPAFLAKLDVDYVVCGHSERRELFGETDEMVAKKVAAILRHGMTRSCASASRSTSARPASPRRRCSPRSAPGWPDAPPTRSPSLVIAYEPIWAIGTGRTATADDAQAVCAAIRADGAGRLGRDAPTRCGSSTAGR